MFKLMSKKIFRILRSKICLSKPKYTCTFQIANSLGGDQTAQMSGLECAFAVCMQKSQGFTHQKLHVH